MNIKELEDIVKKANYTCDVEKQSNKEESAPATEFEHKDLFGYPTKKADSEDKPAKAKPSEDPDGAPKGLPERKNNSNEDGDKADTEKIDTPAQSNDAVTGTGDGKEY
mgnify:CR=1 FL=1